MDEFDYSKFAEFIAQGREIGIRKFYKGAVKRKLVILKVNGWFPSNSGYLRLEFSDWKVVRGKLSRIRIWVGLDNSLCYHHNLGY